MYDELETNLSFEYLKKIIERCEGLKIGVIGGWAVYFYVNDNYRKAFGVDYLRSRDIDLYINSAYALKFKNAIEKLGFRKSSYYFRYELIYDRKIKEIISEESAKKKQIYDIIYIFLDLFTDKQTILNAWVVRNIKNARISVIDNFPVIDINKLLELKILSFFEREKLDKELKDACDIYVLLIYSNVKFKVNVELKKAAEKIVSRNDICDFIAENVLKDSLKAGIVKANLLNIISKKRL